MITCTYVFSRLPIFLRALGSFAVMDPEGRVSRVTPLVRVDPGVAILSELEVFCLSLFNLPPPPSKDNSTLDHPTVPFFRRVVLQDGT